LKPKEILTLTLFLIFSPLKGTTDMSGPYTPGDMKPNNTLQQLLGTFTAKTGSSSKTESTSISADGLNAMLQQILGSTQGLAQVSQGQRSAGLYNSTVNQQLTNDLLTRSAGEVAKATATRTTSGSEKMNPQLDPGKTALYGIGGAAAKSLFGPTVTGIGKKLGADQYGQQLADMLGVGAYTGEGISSAADLFEVGADAGSTALADFFGSASGDLFASQAGDFLGSALSDAFGSTAGDFAVDAGIDFAGEAFGGFADFLGVFADGGKVPKKVGMADGGRVRPNNIMKVPTSTTSGGRTRRGPGVSNEVQQGSTEATTSSNVSNAAAGLGSPSASSLGQVGIAALGGPIGFGLAMANVASSMATGKSLVANILDMISPSTSATGLDGTVGSLGLDASVSDNDAIGMGLGAPADSGASADSGVSAEGTDWNDGGKLPKQPGDPKGIKDTIPASAPGIPKIKLSGGETIIPTDVTEIINKMAPGFFDRLIDMYHTPAEAQMMGGK
jgi:hypothetical protein